MITQNLTTFASRRNRLRHHERMNLKIIKVLYWSTSIFQNITEDDIIIWFDFPHIETSILIHVLIMSSVFTTFFLNLQNIKINSYLLRNYEFLWLYWTTNLIYFLTIKQMCFFLQMLWIKRFCFKFVRCDNNSNSDNESYNYCILV